MFRNLQKIAEQAGRNGPRPPAGMGALSGLLMGGAVLGYMGYSSLYNVEAGHAAVKFSRFGGVQDEVYGVGTHFMIPWVEQPIIYPTRIIETSFPAQTGTKDLQMVDVTLKVLMQPNESHLPEMTRMIGPDYAQKVLPSICIETLKSIVAQYTANQLITRREEISQRIRVELTERARKFHIRISTVAISHLTWGKEYAQAIEDKLVAQQEAERARWRVKEAEQDKMAKIIQAQGEAKSAELIGKAVAKNPAYIELRRLSAAQDIAEVLAHSNNRVYLDSDSLLLNINENVSRVMNDQN
jgi:prohibitin 2